MDLCPLCRGCPVVATVAALVAVLAGIVPVAEPVE